MDEKWKFQKSAYKKENNPNYRGGQEVPCAYCSKLVYRKPWELKKNKNHFCSPQCHDEFRRKPKTRTPISEMHGPKHGRWAGIRYCNICGKELLERKERRRGTCSKECSEIRVKEGRTKAKVSLYGPDAGKSVYTCEYCGKITETTKSIAKRSRFCSNKCHILSGANLQYSKPTRLEIGISEALTELGLEFESQYTLEGSLGIYDFYIPSLNLLIEADGEFWHHSEWANEQFNVQERDARKTKWAEDNSYRLIRLREKDVVKKGALTLLKEIIM